MSVTEQDRERAAATVRALSPEQYVDEFVYDGDVEPLIAAVAQALAEERERAESGAYDRGAADALHGVTAELMPHETVIVAYLRAEADRIRRAAEETDQ